MAANDGKASVRTLVPTSDGPPCFENPYGRPKPNHDRVAVSVTSFGNVVLQLAATWMASRRLSIVRFLQRPKVRPHPWKWDTTFPMNSGDRVNGLKTLEES